MRGLPRAASILVWITALAQVLVAFAEWRQYVRFKDDPASWAPGAIRGVDLLILVPALVTAVVFVVWLWRARATAEAMKPWFPHRHGRGWVIGGWIVPVLFLWFPLHIVEDVITASTPQPAPGEPQRPPSFTNVVYLWWGSWLLYTFADLLPVGPDDEGAAAGDFLWGAATSTATAVLMIVCAFYAVRVIRLITDLQASTPAGELAPGLPPYQR